MSKRGDKLKRVARHQKSSDDAEMTSAEKTFLSVRKDGTREHAYVALKYFQPTHECFSEWNKEELAALSSFVALMSAQSWDEIHKSAGKGGRKVGLGYTRHKSRSSLPQCAVLDNISEDINFLELRVSQKARVHGFRVASAFFLVWLDRNHAIYPE